MTKVCIDGCHTWDYLTGKMVCRCGVRHIMTKANQPKDSPPDIYLTNQKQAQQLYDKNRLKDTDSLDKKIWAIFNEYIPGSVTGDLPGYEKTLTDLIKAEVEKAYLEAYKEAEKIYLDYKQAVLQTVLELPPAHLIGSNGRRSEYIKTSDVQDLIHRISKEDL